MHGSVNTGDRLRVDNLLKHHGLAEGGVTCRVQSAVSRVPDAITVDDGIILDVYLLAQALLLICPEYTEGGDERLRIKDLQQTFTLVERAESHNCYLTV